MRLFPCPDDAIDWGFDIQREEDMSGKDPLSSNVNLLVRAHFDRQIEEPFALQSYTAPMRDDVRKGCGTATRQVCSALTRKVGEGACP